MEEIPSTHKADTKIYTYKNVIIRQTRKKLFVGSVQIQWLIRFFAPLVQRNISKRNSFYRELRGFPSRFLLLVRRQLLVCQRSPNSLDLRPHGYLPSFK